MECKKYVHPPYPQAFQDTLQNEDEHLGYVHKDENTCPTGWYAPGAKTKFDFQDGGITNPRGLALETRDVFDNRSTIEYDSYKMLPTTARQYLNDTDFLETTAFYDYRLLQAAMVTDPNGNRSVFGFSPLGLLMKSGVIGKTGEEQGDIITETPFVWKPSVLMEYNFLAWYEEQKPVWVKTIQNEQHYQVNDESPTIAKVEFSDGFGRLLQTRAQAEDVIFGDPNFGSSGLPADQSATNAPAVGIERDAEDPLNVVVSGWQVYDNKGRVVEQYEPFFSVGLDDYQPAEESQTGQKLTMFYDSAGRVVRTVNPDLSEQRLVPGVPGLQELNLNTPHIFRPSPWESFAYDANDLAFLTHPSGSNVPTSHHNTPKSELKDALGRTIKTIDHKAASDNGTTPVYLDVVMKYQYDIRGNLKVVTDALDRIAFEYDYDFANQPLKTTHIDSGTSKAVIDASGKPIEGNDAKHAQSLASYDRFARPVHAWAKNGSGDSLRMVGFNKYGEEATDPTDNNLLGQLWQQYDEAGKQNFDSYDFKGNLLDKTRAVFSATTLKNELDGYESFLVDWSGLPAILDTMKFQTTNKYDALNRITKITLPENASSVRADIVPSYNRAGALQKVVYGASTYVSHIAYNAKGQRLMLALRSGVMTRYTYDPVTFRLLRQRTEKYTTSQSGNTITYTHQSGTNRQDDAFEFDLVGNILKILHRVTDCGISGSTLGSDALNRNFEYDPLNRLLSATGRESDTHNQNDYLYADAPAPGSPNANNVNEYEQKYQYDKMGNVLQVKQLGTNAFTRNFTYNTDVNTLQKVETGGAALIQDFTYDDSGNQLTAGSTRHYQWTAANRLLIYRNQTGSSDPTIYAQYDYDAAGNRVSKLVRTGTAGSPIYYRTIYIDGIFEFHRLENGTVYKKNYVHLMDNTSRAVTIRIGSVFPDDISDSTVFHIEDHLGGSTIRTNSSGNVIDREEYYPFGDSSLRTFSKKQYRYVGKEKDAESGLYYYGARYYSAWTCRFISVDALAKKYNQLTPYQNAGNNPVGDKDIDGNKSEKTPEGGGGQKEGGGKKGKTNDTPNTTTENIQPHGGGREEFEKDKAAAEASGNGTIEETHNHDGSGTGSITIDGNNKTYSWGPDKIDTKDFEHSLNEQNQEFEMKPDLPTQKFSLEPIPSLPAPNLNPSDQTNRQPLEPSNKTPNNSIIDKSTSSGFSIAGITANIKDFIISKAEMISEVVYKERLNLAKFGTYGKFLKGLPYIGLGIAIADMLYQGKSSNWSSRSLIKGGIGVGLAIVGVAALIGGFAVLGIVAALAGIAYAIWDFSGGLDETLDKYELIYQRR